eukprot:2951178-Pyramimonas_sp.AAC.1
MRLIRARGYYTLRLLGAPSLYHSKVSMLPPSSPRHRATCKSGGLATSAQLYRKMRAEGCATER